MHAQKIRCWQMKMFWELLHSDMQPMACNQTNVLLFFNICLKKGRSHLCAGWRPLRTEHGRTCASQNPRVLKNRNCDKTCSGTITSCSFTFWHHSTPPTVRWCQSACFPMKSSSACYHKCQCVLTITAGVCSGIEVNDQQATVQMDASNSKLLI